MAPPLTGNISSQLINEAGGTVNKTDGGLSYIRWATTNYGKIEWCSGTLNFPVGMTLNSTVI